MRTPVLPILSSLIVLFSAAGFAQTAQVGADRTARGADKLRIEYLHYRQARCETEQVTEFENEFLNEGGLVYLYFTNVSEEPVHLRYWRINGFDTSYYRLNHFVAWDRNYGDRVEPGATGVLEINGVTRDFAPGRDFDFAYMDSTWKPAYQFKGKLDEDPVQVSYIRVLPGMKEIEVHLRHTGKQQIRLESLDVPGRAISGVSWTADRIDGPGHTIARATLAEPLPSASLLIVRVGIEDGGATRYVYAHRRAFADAFPIGVWSNNPNTHTLLYQMHIDTMVAGDNKEAPFFSEVAPRYGFQAMVHTGVPVRVDPVRSLAGHPNVACWMLQDEPDWSIPPNVMLFADESVRMYDTTKPTFITLCRNIKFFEYAPIPDIPCMDHYSVTAPSSSKWPKFYGTRLEETAWYTRDLKMASEPKPIWIWSQAIANWGERPKRPVPTPAELAAQLVLNLGRGAKGILWFNYDEEVAAKYPDVRDAMRGWGRVMAVLREQFLGSEPAALEVSAPDKVDVAPLLSRDALILGLTNTDYEIDPEAYRFSAKDNVKIEVALPPWITPAAALRVSPGGVTPLEFERRSGKAVVDVGRLDVCDVIALFNSADAETACRAAYDQLLARESSTP